MAFALNMQNIGNSSVNPKLTERIRPQNLGVNTKETLTDLTPTPKESARLGRNYQAQTNYPRQQIHLLKQRKSQKSPITHNPVRHTECMWPQWKMKKPENQSLSPTLSNTKRPEMASNDLQNHSSNQIFHNSNRNTTIRSQKRREGSPATCEEAWTCASRSGNGDGQITRRRRNGARGTLLRETKPEPKPEAEGGMEGRRLTTGWVRS